MALHCLEFFGTAYRNTKYHTVIDNNLTPILVKKSIGLI